MVEPFHRLFYLPLSEEAFAQLGLLQNLHENQTLSNDVDSGGGRILRLGIPNIKCVDTKYMNNVNFNVVYIIV